MAASVSSATALCSLAGNGGGSAFDENVGADGCVPYFDSDVGSTGGEIRFVNTVDGVKNTAIAGATFHLTITVQQ